MRFIYLKLKNYIGIYNGMGIDTIEIDMTKCKHRTILIRGENGSGKSTIFNAMTLFPDSNESFIPGKSASKNISIIDDNGIIYDLSFIHNVKPNGTRETTKAYINKNVNGEILNLNEGGNVSSFKDVVYRELELDPNFSSLSQLSLDDKGIATKRPSERKKFVNSIIESLDTYNTIYKNITKKSNQLRSIINSIVNKIENIGDKNSLTNEVKSLESSIDDLVNRFNSLNNLYIELETKINMKDENHLLHNRFVSIKSEKNKLYKKLKSKVTHYISKYNSIIFVYDDECRNIETIIQEYKLKISNTLNQIEVLKTELKSIQEFISSINSSLNEKYKELNSIDNSEVVSSLKAKLHDIENELQQYENIVSKMGINVDGFDKKSFSDSINLIKYMKNCIDLFRDEFSYDIINSVVDGYHNKTIDSITKSGGEKYLRDKVNQYNNLCLDLNNKIYNLEKELSNRNMMDKRPSTCTDTTCFFLTEYLTDRSKENIESDLQKCSNELASYEKKRQEFDDKLKYYLEYIKCSNQLNSIISIIESNKNLFRKFNLFDNKKEFLSRFFNGDDFKYIEKLYTYLDYSNIVDMYNKSKSIYNDIKQNLKENMVNEKIIHSMTSEIARLESNLNDYNDRFKNINTKINQLNTLLSEYNSYMDYNTNRLNEASEIVELKKNFNTVLNEYSIAIKDIQSVSDLYKKQEELKMEMNQIEREIYPKKNELNEKKFNLKQIEEYYRELDELNKQFDHIELIKKYSSPTKGIQLVYMELYMGKILNTANELLSLLFNGEYTIQPFIINESEFRIPCLGNGILNEDISSMSSSQLTMISMIISFALLNASSTKYNVIKLDEIDGPLDENNRVMFIEVLNKIMDIMNVEQCVMVSHSTELQVENSDVILLKSTHLSSDYNRGNVIFKF